MYMKAKYIKIAAIIMIFLGLVSCSEDDKVTTNETIEVPDVYFKIYGATSITSDGTYVTIKHEWYARP